MLQIATAAHSSHFDKPVYHHHHHHYPQQRPTPSSSSSSSSSVQFPRTLSRPQFVEVSRQAIPSELANVPAEYIRRGLRPKANEMLATMSSVQLPANVPRSRLPSHLSLSSPASPSHPSHVLAISSSKSPSEHATLFPIHSLVLASHCAHLPSLPQPKSSSQLPVLHLSIPSPAAFSILHTFMYTHRLESVLKSLLPLPSSFLRTHLSHDSIQATLASGSSLHQLSTYLCSSASGNLHVLTNHAAHVKELWHDMAALGLYDPELWDTLDLAWEIVLGALNLAAAK